MANNLYRKVGEMDYDGLIANIIPQIQVSGGTITRLGAAATYTRGTVLAKSSITHQLVILGTEAAAAVVAADAVYGITSDAAIVSGKTYYTRSGSEGSYVYTPVASPAVENIATYYEITTPAVEAQDAEILTPDCILCDNEDIGISADVPVAVYTAGCFNTDKVTVADGYTMTEADKDKLRERGIVFKAAFPAN